MTHFSGSHSKVVDSQLFARLKRRGLVHQLTDETLGKKLSTSSMTLYAGFDPTSDSLHIGSFMPIMMLDVFKKLGTLLLLSLVGRQG
jgi:tyrosyl-tRNA synthetase